MSLSCECDYDIDPGSTYFQTPKDYSKLETAHRKRCRSCHNLISIDDIVLKFRCYRIPELDSVEERIYGEGGEVPMADQYLCERCGDIYLSLEELGFCMSIDESMDALLLEYQEIYSHD